jgi:peptidyl-Lys metalloendopeptidase
MESLSLIAGQFTNVQPPLATITTRCKHYYYAYGYPNKPYTIYLCKVFWLASLSGTDSQGGTLIHEMSHFTLVAGTNDYVYGQAGARNLAITNPNNAINNADNHEYFAENNPKLP